MLENNYVEAMDKEVYDMFHNEDKKLQNLEEKVYRLENSMNKILEIIKIK